MKSKNSTNDAILIETYAGQFAKNDDAENHFAFVTHNKEDFSSPDGDQREPHPDIGYFFNNANSHYFIQMGGALERFHAELVTDLMMDHEWIDEPRPLSEILNSMEELLDKIWYDRHKCRESEIVSGKIKLVDKEIFPVKNHKTRPIQKNVWEGAKKAAAQKEKKYGVKNLGPWSKFEWGMMNGKLSALRWVLGDEWDMLDT